MKDVKRSSIKKNFRHRRRTYYKSTKVKGASPQRTLRISSKKGTSGIKVQHSDTEHSATTIKGYKIGKDHQNISKNSKIV